MCWYNSARNVSTLLKVYSYDTLLYLVRRFKASSTRRNVTQNSRFDQLPRAVVPNPMHHKFVLYGGRIAAIPYLDYISIRCTAVYEVMHVGVLYFVSSFAQLLLKVYRARHGSMIGPEGEKTECRISYLVCVLPRRKT